MEKRFQEGWETHAKIQACFPELSTEEMRVFYSPDLPFSIGYHAALFDERNNIVFEIKSASWFKRQPKFCCAQLAGYRHFLGAEGIFLLYQKQPNGLIKFWRHRPESLPSWDELKRIALESDKLLLAKEAKSALEVT